MDNFDVRLSSVSSFVPGPIGVFDSGFGGLTILREMMRLMPRYDYVFLGDNARAPYGSRSFDTVYEFTRECVLKLFSLGCPIVILACNTASAKALRTIQQKDLPVWNERKRVLGIIRPTVENVCSLTKTKHIGLFATSGTIMSESYPIEISKIDQQVKVSGVACPMWVPLVENGEYDTPGADYFVQKQVTKLLDTDPQIDTVILGCTHYPLLLPIIRKYVPSSVSILSQGSLVAESLKDYFLRHSDLEQMVTKNGCCKYLTTESAEKFAASASVFLGNNDLVAEKISI